MIKKAFPILITGIILLFTSCVKDSEIIPVACFQPSATEVYVGDLISFSNCSQDAENYSWSFGDGSSSTEVAPSHSYSEAGRYNVTLTAINKSNTHVASQTIIVEEVSPNFDPTIYNSTSGLLSDFWSEDFNGSTTDFPLGTSENSTAEINNGAYRYTNNLAESSLLVWAPVYMPSQTTDYQIDLKMRITNFSGGDYTFASLIWGVNETSLDYFFWGFWNDGEYRAGYATDDWYLWVEDSPGGNAMPGYNLITLRKVGNKYYGFMNESFVFEQNTEPVFGDLFGFFVNSQTTVEIDYFSVNYIGSAKKQAPIKHNKSAKTENAFINK